MPWNEVSDISLLRVATANGTIQAKCSSRERGNIWKNIVINLNEYNDFAVTLLARYKSNARKVINESGLRGEDFSKY